MDKVERESIVNEVVERVTLMIPEIIGNLMMNYQAKLRASEKFYKKHPEFDSHRRLVAATIEKIENKDFSKSIDEILEDAVPEINKLINKTKSLSIDSVSKPDLDSDLWNGEF